MSDYGMFSDDFYINMNLATELDLPQNRESVLHFFEQVRRRFPEMANFYSREKSEYVLEEEKERGAYRWVSSEPRRLNSGTVNPESIESAFELHRTILELVPYELSITPLDCESLSVMFGFDFGYRGNHNEILTQAIGVAPALEKLISQPYGKVLSNEPSIQFSLDEECRTQCRVSFESRTTAYQVRTGEYSEDQLSVYMTVRRFDSLGPNEAFHTEFSRLAALGRDLIDEFLVGNVLRPLQEAISLH
ncbi:hypothetical protein LOC67_14815 [Stieleria sp. JC731]|uniref:hypothetical protein n=1 Tax=Pirellulaceae TaxID=2691357 RepID=UPI001E5CB63A|nr:hypothetical protein [Stieleria sp. JC731]MCC9601830.1 hypothetical protein [Stieleria sp. JC731]